MKHLYICLFFIFSLGIPELVRAQLELLNPEVNTHSEKEVAYLADLEDSSHIKKSENYLKEIYNELCLSPILGEEKKGQDQLLCSDSWVYLDQHTFLEKEYVSSKDYYAIWDSENVNPYSYDIKQFEDTVTISLVQEDKTWCMPLRGDIRINSAFGSRRWRWHHGIDLDLEIGDTIYTVSEGVVRIAKYNRRGYGNYVAIRHLNGLETLYAHLRKSFVKIGDTLPSGAPLGIGGNTGRSRGPHLHFEIRYQGYAFNPSDIFNFKEKKLHNLTTSITQKNYQSFIKYIQRKYVTIQSGDSLWHLSRKYHTSIPMLCRINDISRNTILRIGKKIRIR